MTGGRELTDARYDAVVIGGGHHGTIIACYLARSGMSVGVFERAGRLGGGAATVNGPAVGYRMNTCAHWTRFYNHPSYRDFNLYDEGLRYVYPEENEGMVFDDGSSFIGYSASRVVDPVSGRQERSAENVSRTYEQIKRFSHRDADAYLRLLDQYDHYWKPAFAKHRFTTPPPYGTPDAMEALCSIPDSGMEPVHAHMSLQALAYDFFESDELRTLFMRAATTSTGCFGDDTPGLQGLAHNLPLVLSFEPAAIPIGGTQAISDALISAGRKLGVQYHTKAEVDRVIVNGTRAAGIRLADGSTISADLVVSSLGVPQTVLRLLDDVKISPRIKERIGNIHYDRGQLWWANIAIHEPPAYSAAADNPGLGPQPRLYWGPKDPDHYATRYKAEIYLDGLSRRTFALTSCDTLWDPGRAPEGKHIIGVEEFGAPIRLFDKSQWKDIEKRFNHQLIAHWSHYAPNMTPDNVIATRSYGPPDIFNGHPDMMEGGYSAGSTIAWQQGRYRPIPELSGYRMVLDNVYNCSSNMHSGSGIGRGSSINCWNTIAADLALDAG
jgi:beta-carotene ketolase (CrtO type)